MDALRVAARETWSCFTSRRACRGRCERTAAAARANRCVFFFQARCPIPLSTRVVDGTTSPTAARPPTPCVEHPPLARHHTPALPPLLIQHKASAASARGRRPTSVSARARPRPTRPSRTPATVLSRLVAGAVTLGMQPPGGRRSLWPPSPRAAAQRGSGEWRRGTAGTVRARAARSPRPGRSFTKKRRPYWWLGILRIQLNESLYGTDSHDGS